MQIRYLDCMPPYHIILSGCVGIYNLSETFKGM